MQRDDAQIISKILSGDPSGYPILFERYVLSVEEVIARTWDLELPEQVELVEETFVHAFSNLCRLREPSRFDAYLLGVAHGLALQRRAILRGIEMHFSEKPNFDVSCLQSPGTRDELMRCLREALASLDPAIREMAEACYFGDQVRPQLLAASRSLEVAQVGASLKSAWMRFKAHLAARLLDAQKALPSDAVVCAPSAEPRHLSEDLYQALLHGDPVGAAQPLAQHLRSGCATCEAFLGRQSSADALDGLIDAALFAPAQSRCRRNPAMFARILRRLKIDARLSGGQAMLSGLLVGQQQHCAPLILAGLLGLAGIVVFALRMTPSFQASLDNEAQRDVQIAFYLADLVPGSGGEGLSDGERLVDGLPGQSCPETAQLVLSYHLLRSRFVAITRIRPDHSLELLELPGRRPPGRHVLSINGVPARLLLKNAVGHNRFAVLASERPFGTDQLKSILAHLQEEVPDVDEVKLPPGMALTWFDLEVTPGSP